MLNIGDFNSCQDMFRSLATLLNSTKEKMLIATSLAPDYYLLKSLNEVNFKEFYDIELSTRKEIKLPPYYHLALVSIRSLDKDKSQKAYSRMSLFFQRNKFKQIIVSPASTRLRERVRGKYYKYLLIKSKKIKLLNNILKKSLKMFRGGDTIITVNINPK
jgi:primosomal protein N'